MRQKYFPILNFHLNDAIEFTQDAIGTSLSEYFTIYFQ